MRTKILALVAAGVLLLGVGCGRAGGESSGGPQAAPYEGKRITVLVPFAPGGAADVVTRLIAESWPEHIAGRPTIVVENLTGGGGAVAMQRLMSRPADGMTLVAGNAGMILRHMLGEPGHDYPLPSMQVVGVIPAGLVTVTTPAYPDVDSLVDAREPVSSGGVAAGGQAPTTEVLAARMLGIPLRQVFGYEGYGPIALAVQRGEVVMASPGDSAYLSTYKDLVESRALNVQFQTGLVDADGKVVRSPVIPDVPTVTEIMQQRGVEPPDQATANAFDAMTSLATLATALIARPDAPKEQLDALRASFEELAESPQWKERTTQAFGSPLPMMSAEAARPAYEKIFNLSNGVVETIRAAAAEGGS